MNIPEASLDNAKAFWLKEKLDYFDAVLLLPQNNARRNALFRNAFTKKLGGRQGIVIEGGQAQALLTLYSLYAFTDKLIVGSFELPYGRKLHNLLDCGIATEDVLINDVILGGLHGTML